MVITKIRYQADEYEESKNSRRNVMDLTFEIQLSQTEIPAKALMYIKQKTGLSLAEIKKSAEMNQSFFGCELSDDKNLALIIEIHEKLNSMGVSNALLEDGKVESLELFKNILDSHRETAHEIGLDEYLDL